MYVHLAWNAWTLAYVMTSMSALLIQPFVELMSLVPTLLDLTAANAIQAMKIMCLTWDALTLMSVAMMLTFVVFMPLVKIFLDLTTVTATQALKTMLFQLDVLTSMNARKLLSLQNVVQMQVVTTQSDPIPVYVTLDTSIMLPMLVAQIEMNATQALIGNGNVDIKETPAVSTLWEAMSAPVQLDTILTSMMVALIQTNVHPVELD